MTELEQTLDLMRESVRRFIEREVVRKMGELGFLGLRYPEEAGGGGMDARATAMLAEELGRSTFGGFAITVLVHTDMASPHLANAGTPEQVKRFLPGIVSGGATTRSSLDNRGRGPARRGWAAYFYFFFIAASVSAFRLKR